MAYTPTVWATGDVITAEKLNKAEQGIADAYEVFTVTVTESNGTYTADKTYAEIVESLENGSIPMCVSAIEGVGTEYFYLTTYDSEYNSLVFATIPVVSASRVQNKAINIDNTNSVSLSSYTFTGEG